MRGLWGLVVLAAFVFAPDACCGSTRKPGGVERAALLSAQLQGVEEAQVRAKPQDTTTFKAGAVELAALLPAQIRGIEAPGAMTHKFGAVERTALLSAQLQGVEAQGVEDQLQGVEARTKLQNAAVRRTPERQVHQQSGSAAGSGHRLLETDGPPADVGKRWLVDGCPQQTTGLDVEPALADADQSLGEVQCCTAEFTATRVGCLSGSNTAAKVTFWEARALCEGRGWRLCRREEIDTGNGGGACGTGCGYDSTKLWAELNSPAPQRWLVDGCPQQTTDLDVEPALADADQSLGEVQCCTAEFTATREGCLSGSNTAAKVTFWEAKDLCEGRGWRLCRREEIDTGNGGGACGTGCGYDSNKLWADLNPACPTDRWPGAATYSVSQLSQYGDVWSHPTAFMPADGATWTLYLEAKNLLGTTDREFGYPGCGGWLAFTVPSTATEWTPFTVSSGRCSSSSSLALEYRSTAGWSSGSDAVDLRNIKLYKTASVSVCCMADCSTTTTPACPTDLFPGAATYSASQLSQFGAVWSHPTALMPTDGATWTLYLEAKNLLGTTDREFGYPGCGGWLVFTVPSTATEWTPFTVSSGRCSSVSSLALEYRSTAGWSSGSDAVDFRNIKLYKTASVSVCCMADCTTTPTPTTTPAPTTPEPTLSFRLVTNAAVQEREERKAGPRSHLLRGLLPVPLSSTSVVEVEVRISVPRIMQAEALSTLAGFSAWASEQGLPAVATTGQVQLTCGAGFERSTEATDGAGNCTACAVGKYKNQPDDSDCIRCPEHSSTLSSGSLILSECVCNASFYSTAPLSSSHSCFSCTPGFFCPGRGERFPCANGSSSEAGAAACADCPEDTFKPNAGPGRCMPCAEGEEAQPGSVSCSPSASCIVNVSAPHLPCLCALGYTGPDGGRCVRCEAGKFKDTNGSSACTPCGQGRISARGAAFCVCAFGYTGPDGGECKACGIGTFKNVSGSRACVFCPADTYSDRNASVTCTSCGRDASGMYDLMSDMASVAYEACTCSPGFQSERGFCAPCPVNTYKASRDEGACTWCPPNSFTSELASSECACLPGFEPEYNSSLPHLGGRCVACTSGFFKAEPGGSACRACPPGTYASPPAAFNLSDCAVCPPGMLQLGTRDGSCMGPTFGSRHHAGHRDGPGTQALFSSPAGMGLFFNTSSQEQVVLIADKMNHVIRALHPHSDTARVTTLAGMPAVASFKNGRGSRARFNEPNAVLAVLVAGRSLCMVADGNNNRIRALDLDTLRVSTIAGSAAGGYSDGSGSTSTFFYPSALATLQNPSSPSAKSVVVWVADMYNSVVRRLEVEEDESAPSGASGLSLRLKCSVDTLRLVDAATRAPVSLVYPMGLAASTSSASGPSPLLYIADQLQRRILRVDLGAMVSPAQRNVSLYVCHVLLQRHPQDAKGACAKGTDFNYPRGIALTTNAHQLLVADSDAKRVRVVQNMHVNSSFASSPSSWSWTAEISTLPNVLSIHGADAGRDVPDVRLLSPEGLAVLATHVGDVVLVSDAASHVVRPLFVGAEHEPEDLHLMPSTCAAAATARIDQRDL